MISLTFLDVATAAHCVPTLGRQTQRGPKHFLQLVLAGLSICPVGSLALIKNPIAEVCR